LGRHTRRQSAHTHEIGDDGCSCGARGGSEHNRIFDFVEERPLTYVVQGILPVPQKTGRRWRHFAFVFVFAASWRTVLLQLYCYLGRSTVAVKLIYTGIPNASRSTANPAWI